MDKKRIKIFVISPNDVKTERLVVKDVCNALNESVGETIEIVPLIWEDRPLSYSKTPQESVDPLLEEADIYVVILWYRLGTPVEGCRGAMAVYAEGSDNIADFWKFFPKPKIAKLTDSDGNSYRFKSTTLKYGKTSEDWTKIRPGERHIEQFVFAKEKEDEPVGELTFSFLVYLAMLDNKGKARVSNATLYLERLAAN